MPRKNPQPDVDDDGYLVLRGALFWEWRAITEQVHRVDSELKLKSLEVEKILDEHPELRSLLNTRAALVQTSGTVRIEYQHLLDRLATHLGFPMKDVSIDDLTGRIHQHGEPTLGTITTRPAKTKKTTAIKPKTRK